MKVALLGAESTGKTWLAQALGAHYQALGRRVLTVPEVLRLWCAAQQRTPRADEQGAIAQAQAAAETRAETTDLLVADTSPLMTAVYSDLIFGDTSLYPFALAHQRRYDLTLVTGLDLPWVADGLQRDGPQVREPVTRAVRAALDQAGLPYRVVYGRGQQRLHNALIAIESIAKDIHSTRAEQQNHLERGRRGWRCEHCSDPDCERRLFSSLLPPADP